MKKLFGLFAVLTVGFMLLTFVSVPSSVDGAGGEECDYPDSEGCFTVCFCSQGGSQGYLFTYCNCEIIPLDDGECGWTIDNENCTTTGSEPQGTCDTALCGHFCQGSECPDEGDWTCPGGCS